MPNILVKIPYGSFPGQRRGALVQQINDAAAAAEQIPDESRKRFLCWVLVEEVEQGAWTCGGVDVTAQVLPCIAVVHVPAGVLDETARDAYAQLMHAAFTKVLPPSEARRLSTSVIFHDVPDGAWGANGVIWKLADFAREAGYGHLQHLVRAA